MLFFLRNSMLRHPKLRKQTACLKILNTASWNRWKQNDHSLLKICRKSLLNMVKTEWPQHAENSENSLFKIEIPLNVIFFFELLIYSLLHSLLQSSLHLLLDFRLESVDKSTIYLLFTDTFSTIHSVAWHPALNLASSWSKNCLNSN